MDNKARMLGAGLMFSLIAVVVVILWATGHANPLVPAVGTDMACPAIVGGIPDVVGSADGNSMTCFVAPTSVGPTGPQGPAGTPALNYGARAQTDATGLYVWTFPAGCLHSGNIPYFNAIAEGPTPQGGTTVNPQIEGVPTATTVSFRVTRVSATTVALIGLTILSVNNPVATYLDMSCAPQ